MNAFKITMEDGNKFSTEMNATLAEAQDYYLGKCLNFGDTDECPKDKMVKVVNVEKLPQYTPEPWTNNHYDQNGYICISGKKQYGIDDNAPICKVICGLTHDPIKGMIYTENAINETEANSRLITASPQLLSKLKELLFEFEYVADELDYNTKWHEKAKQLIEETKLTIDKAE